MQVREALERATGPSFGSACLGALLVSAIAAAKALARSLHDLLQRHYYHGSLGLALGVPQGGGGGVGRYRYSGSHGGGRGPHPWVAGCATGTLRALEWACAELEAAAKYFNKFAYVYAAVYGDDFGSAGQRAFRLFRGLGWEAIVNDSLIDAALSLGGVASGALVGLVGWAFGRGSGLGDDACVFLAALGIVLGYGMCAVLMHGLVTSAVATVFVCFAHDSEAFGRLLLPCASRPLLCSC